MHIESAWFGEPNTPVEILHLLKCISQGDCGNCERLHARKAKEIRENKNPRKLCLENKDKHFPTPATTTSSSSSSSSSTTAITTTSSSSSTNPTTNPTSRTIALRGALPSPPSPPELGTHTCPRWEDGIAWAGESSRCHSSFLQQRSASQRPYPLRLFAFVFLLFKQYFFFFCIYIRLAVGDFFFSKI